MKAKEIVEALKTIRNKKETRYVDTGGPGRASFNAEFYILDDSSRDILKEAEHKIKALSKKNKELKERIAELEEYKVDRYLEDEYPDGWTM